MFYCLSMAAATQVDRIRLLAFRHIYPRSVKYCVCISLSVGAYEYMPPHRAYNSPINKRRWRRTSSLVPHLRDVPSPFWAINLFYGANSKEFPPKNHNNKRELHKTSINFEATFAISINATPRDPNAKELCVYVCQINHGLHSHHTELPRLGLAELCLSQLWCDLQLQTGVKLRTSCDALKYSLCRYFRFRYNMDSINYTLKRLYLKGDPVVSCDFYIIKLNNMLKTEEYPYSLFCIGTVIKVNFYTRSRIP